MTNVKKKMSVKQNPNKRVAMVLVENEVLFGATLNTLEGMDYGVRMDVQASVISDFAVVGSYFLWLGVVKQVHALNPSLPLILLATPPYELNGDGRHFFGVIGLNGNSEMDAREKISKWFTEGQGKFLIQRRR